MPQSVNSYQMDTYKRKRSPAIRYGCPVEVTAEIIGGKWKCTILWWLRQDAKSFGELKQLMSGITSKVLSQQLQELEAEGLIHREAYRETPPRVEYSLTTVGETLRPITELMCEWGKNHLPGFRFGVFNLDKLQILLVTNDANVREFLRNELESREARVIGVTSTIEALEQLHQLQPDALIVDMEMPDAQGCALMVETLDAEQKVRIPAIALTSRLQSVARREARRAGFHVHLAKPIEPAELVATLVSLILNPR